ncbi:hypothetical protein D6789_03725 [Candidatus Woesearchaeota archaeon]|nr:MAG: hypothetical protein D6789_03725 [Candidatus Woesearchaeota archaeon]
MDLSNKSLALILVAAIVVSLGGTLVSMNRLNKLQAPIFTGFATGSDTATGLTNLTIESNLAITINHPSSANRIDFGAGYVDGTGGGIQYCFIDTNGTNATDTGTNHCKGFNNVTVNYWNDSTQATHPDNEIGAFKIRNDGNKDVRLNISVNNDKDSFIGGTNPEFAGWIDYNNTNNSGETACTGNQRNFTSWTNFTTSPGIGVCGNFNFEDSAADYLYLHVRVGIPEDAAPVTSSTSTITVTGWTP